MELFSAAEGSNFLNFGKKFCDRKIFAFCYVSEFKMKSIIHEIYNSYVYTVEIQRIQINGNQL